jgi:hypothetical protein
MTLGLISFVKSAGERLFGASEAKAATPDALQKELEKHGLDIAVEGDKVHVTGSAANTEQAEKIAIALGNTVSVQTVQSDINPAAARPNRSSIRPAHPAAELKFSFFGPAEA